MVTIVKLGDRKMSLGGRDRKAEQKEKRVEERIMKEESRKRKYEEMKRKQEENQRNAHAELEAMFPEDLSTAEKESSDSSYAPPESRRRIEIPPLNMPRNVLMQQDVAECMIREQITGTMAVAFLSAIVSASGGKVANYFLNAGNVSERRGAVARKMAEAEKRKYKAPNPCVLQWDEKRMERYGEEQIRMPLVVSGDERPPKMLGS